MRGSADQPSRAAASASRTLRPGIPAPPPGHLLPTPLHLTDREIRRLGEGHLVLREAAAPERLVADSVELLATLHAQGHLRLAGTGRKRHADPTIRGDAIGWLSDQAASATRTALLDHFEAWRGELNREAWLGLRRFEVQLSCYPAGGARYDRHRDALPGGKNRILTAILYLNRDWVPAQGGTLRAWTPDGVVEVSPEGGRLVLFLSERVPHEVLPVWGARYAATGWYRATEEIPLLPDPELLREPESCL